MAHTCIPWSMAKPMKTLELHYPMIKFLIIIIMLCFHERGFFVCLLNACLLTEVLYKLNSQFLEKLFT